MIAPSISRGVQHNMTCARACSQDFVQEGAKLPRAQGTRTKNQKLRFGPLFWGSGQFVFFLIFAIKLSFIFLLRGPWPPCHSPLGYVPVCAELGALGPQNSIAHKKTYSKPLIYFRASISFILVFLTLCSQLKKEKLFTWDGRSGLL